MLPKLRGKRPYHGQQGTVSIGEAWDSLELKLNLMEAENVSDYPPMSTI